MQGDVVAGPSNAKINGHVESATIHPVEMSGLAASHLSGSQDLMTLFGLGQCYDRYVRPYIISNTAGAAGAGGGFENGTSGDIKGKGRAANDATTPLPDGSSAAVPALAVNGTQPAKEKEKVKSMKKHYSHLIADVPGQNKLAKDNHLRDLMLNPDPPQGISLLRFDDQALRDALTLEAGLLPEFDNSIWRADADEKRKKKKRKADDGNLQNGAPSPANAGTPGGSSKKRKGEGK